MKLTLSSPTRAYFQGTDEELSSLKDQLTYKDLSIAHEIKRISKNHWFKSSNPEKYELTLKMLKEQLWQTLVYDDGPLKYIRPGSIPYLTGLNVEIDDQIIYPKPKKIPWFRELPFKLYDYQKDTTNLLIEVKHGNGSLTTASGKSAIALSLYRETGLKCAIVAPSKAIFKELVEKFEHHFGKGSVGKFGNGQKKIGKKITICIGDSLCNVKEGSPEWDFFSKLEMIVIDESHEWGADTLEDVCHGLFSGVPWRFFLSATQLRGDGGTKLLQSIIGPTVYTLTTKEAVDGGYICKHDFRIVQVKSSDPSLSSSDALEEKRIHLLRNRNIAVFSAKLANVMAERNEQTLILVEELNQVSMLVKLLTVPFAYAHSETKKERLLELGLEKVDTQEQIEKFNKNEVKVLIGTSCLHVGVNIFPMTNTINWVGGASEIKARQAAIGRSVRLPTANPYKAKCGPKEKVTIWDFDIQGNFVLERHLEQRMACYKDSGDNLIKYIRLK